MQAWCRITTLELKNIARLQRHDTERLSAWLTQLPRLTHLDLSLSLSQGTVKILAQGLGHCRELVHLNLAGNHMGDAQAACLEGVLRQCVALAHVDLSENALFPTGADILFREMSECTVLTRLDCSWNNIGDSAADSLHGCW